jgi:hypothetical protein
MNKYYDAHKEEYKKSALEYYEQHKEERKKKMGEYYEKNKETILNKARVRNAQYTPKSKTYKTKEGLMKLIYSVAKKNNLLLSYSPDRIVNAKLRICKDDLKRCPCDNKPDSLRWCGSEKCVKECKENGKCHCGLFYYDKRGEKK